jgi:L-asparaginase
VRIRVISTGGTIVSFQGAHGFEPGDVGAASGWLKSRFPSHEFSVVELMSLDSSNIGPDHWQCIASEAWRSLEDFDGAVITHGTDTMAYTASAMAFMMGGLTKPVTLTGSQIPFGGPMSDAPSNMALAVAAVERGLAGVTVSFGDVVINGTRAVKTSASAMRAFESVGAPPVAVATAFGLDAAGGRTRHGNVPARLDTRVCPEVFLLKLSPGANPDIFGELARMGYRGIVIEAFGAGNVPCSGRDVAGAVRLAVEGGIAVVTRSQCLRGGVDMSAYETGVRLLEAGAISAGDMTTEAAVVKLMCALGRTGDVGEIAEIFQTNFVGEMTPN